MVERFFLQDGTIFSPWRNDLLSGIFSLNHRQAEREIWRMQRESKNRSEQKRLFFLLKLPAIRFLLLFLHFVIFRLEMRTEPTTYNLLSTITFPEDLRQLSVEELPEVCKELRQDIIKEVSCNPGHFAASLGTVELTVALHYVFNTPYDRIVWDVGHQAYGHKILTGRREAFSTNRKFKGVRPFPSPEESDYDTFTCGHASNSISAALGMAVAAAEKGEKDRDCRRPDVDIAEVSRVIIRAINKLFLPQRAQSCTQDKFYLFRVSLCVLCGDNNFILCIFTTWNGYTIYFLNKQPYRQ